MQLINLKTSQVKKMASGSSEDQITYRSMSKQHSAVISEVITFWLLSRGQMKRPGTGGGQKLDAVLKLAECFDVQIHYSVLGPESLLKYVEVEWIAVNIRD